jgi:hypothetical protein
MEEAAGKQQYACFLYKMQHIIEKLYQLFSFIFLPSELTDSMKAGNMPPQYYQGSDWLLFIFYWQLRAKNPVDQDKLEHLSSYTDLAESKAMMTDELCACCQCKGQACICRSWAK